MKQATKMIGVLLAVTWMVAACQKESGTGMLTVRMKDAPVDFDQVNVEIEQIKVSYSDDGGPSGWFDLATNAGIYDLLILQDSVTAALVVGQELPVGHVEQMRIILGDDNWVLVDSVAFPLELSSQDKSGLKINLNTTINPGDEVEVLFDFDAEKSIVVQGDGSFKLKPVLHLESVVFL